MRSHCCSLLLQKQKLIQNSLLLLKQNLTINNAKAAPIHWVTMYATDRHFYLMCQNLTIILEVCKTNKLDGENCQEYL